VRARLCRQEKNEQGKGDSLSKAINIIENGLRVSLDEESKEEITQNLIDLYRYMVRRLLQANLRNDVSAVEEVEALMRNIADAWKESLLSPSLIQDPV
ncbi:flagellar export chaperone FliS, partial [Escherichia coli]|uniref:flagellar export chaperone FliS n=1 Tax=Escherichia coli TaxID=562 RepID=UPI001C7080B7